MEKNRKKEKTKKIEKKEIKIKKNCTNLFLKNINLFFNQFCQSVLRYAHLSSLNNTNFKVNMFNLICDISSNSSKISYFLNIF